MWILVLFLAGQAVVPTRVPTYCRLSLTQIDIIFPRVGYTSRWDFAISAVVGTLGTLVVLLYLDSWGSYPYVAILLLCYV